MTKPKSLFENESEFGRTVTAAQESQGGDWFQPEDGNTIELSGTMPAIRSELLRMGFRLVHKPKSKTASTAAFYQATEASDMPGLKWDKGSVWRLVQEGDKKTLVRDEELEKSLYAKTASKKTAPVVVNGSKRQRTAGTVEEDGTVECGFAIMTTDQDTIEINLQEMIDQGTNPELEPYADFQKNEQTQQKVWDILNEQIAEMERRALDWLDKNVGKARDEGHGSYGDLIGTIWVRPENAKMVYDEVVDFQEPFGTGNELDMDYSGLHPLSGAVSVTIDIFDWPEGYDPNDPSTKPGTTDEGTLGPNPGMGATKPLSAKRERGARQKKQAQGITIEKIKIEILPDDSPDLSHLEQTYEDPSIPPEEAEKYRQQDKARMETYGQDWDMVGVRAVANLQFSGGILQSIESPGLWGIESDSGDEYFREVADDELDSLRTMLQSMNADMSNFDELAEQAKANIDA